MKAWRQQPRNKVGASNHTLQKRVGSTDRNSFFRGGSPLLQVLLAKAGILKLEINPEYLANGK